MPKPVDHTRQGHCFNPRPSLRTGAMRNDMHRLMNDERFNPRPSLRTGAIAMGGHLRVLRAGFNPRPSLRTGAIDFNAGFEGR